MLRAEQIADWFLEQTKPWTMQQSACSKMLKPALAFSLPTSVDLPSRAPVQVSAARHPFEPAECSRRLLDFVFP